MQQTSGNLVDRAFRLISASSRTRIVFLVLLAFLLSSCNNLPLVGGLFPADEAQTAAADSPAGEAGPSRIPQEIARLQLVDGDAQLRDFRLDADAGIAYVTDSRYRLHLISLDPLEKIATYETTGDILTLDAANNRLYIAPYAPRQGTEAAITVFDTAGRAPLWAVLGSRISVDSARNRYYVGDVTQIASLGVNAAELPQGVRLYDGGTQQLLAQGEAGGTPLYNPVRDELIVISQGAVTVDPESLATRDELFPDIVGQPLPGCTGCRYVRDGRVLESEGLVVFSVATLGGGGGTGEMADNLLFDAATMSPSSDPRFVGETCGSEPVLIQPIGDGYLQHDLYSRYEVYNNLFVRDAAGANLAFKDGLGAPFVNPTTGAAYIPTWSNGNWIIDARTLAPLGVTAGWCPWETDANGTTYAADAARQSVIALAPTGGATMLPVAEPLVEGEFERRVMRQIIISPDYANDNTLFLVTSLPAGGDHLLRSTDSGATWTVLGGIPTGENLNLTLAISPDFANDGTLFLGGFRFAYAGEGVWRSTDRGDTWTPLWNGLDHLRVKQIVLSPEYAADGALLAYSDFVQIDPWQQGVSIWRSGDQGASWQQMTSAENDALLPPASTWLPIPIAAELPVRKLSYAEPIQVQGELGVWMPAPDNLGANQSLRAILPVPNSNDLYVVTDMALYRTRNGGATWEQWQDPRVGDGTWERLIASAAISPALDDGSYRLFLGTSGGLLLQLDPATLVWGAPGASIAAPTPTPDAPLVEPTATPNNAPVETATDAPAMEITVVPDLPAELTEAPTQNQPSAATPAPVATATLPGSASENATGSTSAPATPEAQGETGVPAPAATATLRPSAPASGATPIQESTNGSQGATNGSTDAATPAAPAPPLPTATPFTGTPVAPQGLWGSRWAADPALQEALGLAHTTEPESISAAYQFFQNGTMAWLSDEGSIYVILNDGTWQAYVDTFEEGEMERDPNIYTPGELLQPERGFGKLWREHPGLREAIGWATAEEQGIIAQVQRFERGTAIRLSGLEYILFGTGGSGTWQP